MIILFRCVAWTQRSCFVVLRGHNDLACICSSIDTVDLHPYPHPSDPGSTTLWILFILPCLFGCRILERQTKCTYVYFLSTRSLSPTIFVEMERHSFVCVYVHTCRTARASIQSSCCWTRFLKFISVTFAVIVTESY